MKRQKPKPWYVRIFELTEERGASKHERGRSRPHGWHQKLRRERKAQKLARREQRGKR